MPMVPIIVFYPHETLRYENDIRKKMNLYSHKTYVDVVSVFIIPNGRRTQNDTKRHTNFMQRVPVKSYSYFVVICDFR